MTADLHNDEPEDSFSSYWPVLALAGSAALFVLLLSAVTILSVVAAVMILCGGVAAIAWIRRGKQRQRELLKRRAGS
jgi:Flp pilus assembly protein TadB